MDSSSAANAPLVAPEWQDITIIPRGVIRKLTYLSDAGSAVRLQVESA
ncbi:MAG TPA: hypothetical protein VFC31_10200 [Candidatus Limnocylindria bacterium]|nr:hypothetical protein [Candidatus Limnocylindria bacterium]